MNSPRDASPALVRGTLLSLLVYLLVGGALGAIAQGLLPGDLDVQGRVVGQRLLTIDLLSQGVAAFLAGAAALRFARDRVVLATTVMGGVLMLVLVAATCAMWSAAPPWFNLLALAITWPLFALGVAWRGAGVARTPA